MNHFVTLCYCALDRQRCPKDLNAQPKPRSDIKYQCEAQKTGHTRCEREKKGSYLCATHYRLHVGETKKCVGITRKNNKCGRDVVGISYCREHGDQESMDVEMEESKDIKMEESKDLSEQVEESEDVEMGGT